MDKVITGNQAVSHAVRLAKVDVIAAYPITPQTSIVEELSEMCADGRLSSHFIHCESEHSSMSACIGASVSGARAFTATSSQGLAYMHEMLHWAAGGRLPIVMAEVNRSLAPPWTIYTDQQDSLSQRDTGWLQFYCRDNQEVLDTTIVAFKVAERISLPVMVVFDAFVTSHTSEAVHIPEQQVVDNFLPKRVPAFKVDTKNPCAYGGMKGTASWMETRVDLQSMMESAVGIVREEVSLWEIGTGRTLNTLQSYHMEDAEVAILAAGSAASTITLTVDELRKRGIKAGSLGLWMFRPFPTDDLRKALSNVNDLVVLDRSCSYGHSGIFAQECRSALYDTKKPPSIHGLIGGLGGREVSVGGLADEVVASLLKNDKELYYWLDARKNTQTYLPHKK